MDNIYYEFASDIEEILDGKASEEEKNEIIESLWLIFQQEKMKIIDKYKMKDNIKYVKSTQTPYINLYLSPFCSQHIQSPMIQSPIMQQQMMQSPIMQQQMMQSLIMQQQMMQSPIMQQQMMQSPAYQAINYFPSKKSKKSKKEKDKKKNKDKKANKDKKHKKSDHKKELEFNPQPGKNFDGIMRYLTNESGGNIHDNGTVVITSNSISGSSHPKNLVNYKDDSRYQCLMHGTGNAFICFDFKDMLIQLSNYTIQSNNCIGKDWYDLRNWVIEVSDNGEKWKEIDSHTNDPALNGQNIIHTFNVQNPNNGFHRYVRLRQTGKTWSQPNDPYHFFFPYLEFYGKIKIPSKKFKK